MRFQAAIVGGGPAGAVAALVLARRGVRVAVLEAHTGPTLKVGETLPPSLAPLLSHLGLDVLLAGDGHLRSQGNRSLWGSATPVDSPFLANPYGAGWHVDRRRFEARLAAAACDAGAAWFWGCRVRRVRGEPGESRWQLDLADGRTLEADFLADATGRPAHFARRRGGARRLRYDRLVGISALLPVLEPTFAVDSYTLVEAAEEGWWYSAPLADGRLAVALMGDGDLLDRALFVRVTAADVWWRRLAGTDAIRRRVEAHGTMGAAVQLAVQPAESSRLDRIVGDGWIALGDAATAYDPLSSHGVAAAMGSGFYGGHSIADLLAGREEAGDAYLDVMQRTYGGYLNLLRERYAAQRRFPGSEFWRRRQAVGFADLPL
jgi:flavin-dependent dehydrogenase